MKGTKWTDEEVHYLIVMIYKMGYAEGIKEFQKQFPGRTYSSCYKKFNRCHENYEVVDISTSEDNQGSAVKPVEKKKASLLKRFVDFFKNLFS